MAQAYGSSAHLLMKRETTYGQAATGNYVRMPFNRCNLGSEQGLIDDPVLGQGRDPLAPLQDVINDEGDVVVPVDPRYLGLWLTGLFGDPDTTDNLDGSWDHEFVSGGDDLPSYTVEVGMPKVPAFFRHAGVKLNSIALEFTRSGPAAATISAIAQGETRFGTTQGGTPTSLTFSRISQFQGSIKRAGSPVGNLTGGAVTYSNNLGKIETIRDDGLIEGADPTIAALTGRIDVRFADTTLIDLAADGTRSTWSSPTRCGAGKARAHCARGLPAQAQARSRRTGRRAGELRLAGRQERCGRAHADGPADQRS
jgi:Phage tail tube protein